MSIFASAVEAVIGQLEQGGCEIVEAVFEEGFTPHIVAQLDGQLLFALVLTIEGPHVRDLDDDWFDTDILPQVNAATDHPKAGAVAQLASAHGAQAGLFVVVVLPTSRRDEQGEPLHMARVFPFRPIDASGAVITERIAH